MTYKQIAYLKFKKGMTTYQLARQFPKFIQQVSEVALLDLSENTLRELLREEKAIHRLMRLKKRFSKYMRQQAA
jgi:hypothetical protein